MSRTELTPQTFDAFVAHLAEGTTVLVQGMPTRYLAEWAGVLATVLTKQLGVEPVLQIVTYHAGDCPAAAGSGRPTDGPPTRCRCETVDVKVWVDGRVGHA